MKDFRKILVERKNGLDIRMFEGIKIGDYILSIQASDFHYCEPRKTLNDLNLYKAWEIGIFNSNNEWVNISKFKYRRVFSGWLYYEYFINKYDGMVAGRIETVVVQSLLDFIDNNIKEN
ncbi:hypothetical protein [Clostridium thermobutyricum]|uniref:hypothetical protein n=1 Tax=Clostridium thermobutyricum TaxID=29372 RepID=UPI0029428EB3|nr:hypothetical protein [Clostridium thermobutyricum]